MGSLSPGDGWGWGLREEEGDLDCDVSNWTGGAGDKSTGKERFEAGQRVTSSVLPGHM